MKTLITTLVLAVAMPVIAYAADSACPMRPAATDKTTTTPCMDMKHDGTMMNGKMNSTTCPNMTPNTSPCPMPRTCPM